MIHRERGGQERTFMTSKVFIDTNILVYAADQHESEKQEICRDVLKSLVHSEQAGVISTQLLQEFYVTATRTR